MSTRRDAAYVAHQVGKTANWVKRNAANYAHHRAGRTYFWTDDDIAEMLKAMERRPAKAAPTGLAPLGPGRRS